MEDPAWWPAPRSIANWVGGLVSGGAATTIVMLLIKWRKEMSSITREEKRATIEVELSAKERVTKVDMAVHAQVVAQLTSIIADERQRTDAIAKQSLERELQLQDVINTKSKEHQECIQRLGNAEGELRFLRQRVESLEDRVEARDLREVRRRMPGGRRADDPPVPPEESK